ncbi:hypothetical protein [Catenuloplanes japonicus]|uniref:hypothetical protein n=1 Tax=Catenuloplanes japonicus TaxID=33876 RepID=UPI000527B830|nr:hypothetical protein [Catenuloplanes japonicus]
MRHRTLALVAAVMIALTSACGGAEEPAAPPAPQTLEDYRLAFSACMREHGMNMPDPDAGGGIQLDTGGDQAAFQTAAEACQSELGEPPAGEGGVPNEDERIARQLEISACLREHGVEVKDPKPGELMELPREVPQDVMDACGLAMGATGAGQ